MTTSNKFHGNRRLMNKKDAISPLLEVGNIYGFFSEFPSD